MKQLPKGLTPRDPNEDGSISGEALRAYLYEREKADRSDGSYLDRRTVDEAGWIAFLKVIKDDQDRRGVLESGLCSCTVDGGRHSGTYEVIGDIINVWDILRRRERVARASLVNNQGLAGVLLKEIILGLP
jgi:hypothetical protein